MLHRKHPLSASLGVQNQVLALSFTSFKIHEFTILLGTSAHHPVYLFHKYTRQGVQLHEKFFLRGISTYTDPSW